MCRLTCLYWEAWLSYLVQYSVRFLCKYLNYKFKLLSTLDWDLLAGTWLTLHGGITDY